MHEATRYTVILVVMLLVESLIFIDIPQQMSYMQRKERDPPSYDSFCSPIPLSMTEKKMEHNIYVLSSVCIIINDEEDFDLPSMSWKPTLC
jgi:hypothetical protein